jgi:hypothetical protein
MSNQVGMIHELSDNELDIVSGAKGKEAEASRYEYQVMDWGAFKFGWNKAGDWGMTFNGVCCGYLSVADQSRW